AVLLPEQPAAGARMSAPSDSDLNARVPFLDTDPPHWAARGLSWILLALFAAAALAIAVVRIPETVSSPFVLVPIGGTDPVRALQDGVVMQVGVREGQTVRQGELLFTIRTHPMGDRAADLGTLETQVAGAAASIANAETQYRSEQLGDGREKLRLQTRVADLDQLILLKRKQLALTGVLLTRYETLREGGHGSGEQLIQHQLATQRIEVELTQAKADRHEAQAGLDKLGHESQAREVRHRELLRSLDEGSHKASIRIRSLQEDPQRSTSGALSITAPCAGTVIRQPVKAVGAVVMEGDVLGEMACAGERLQAELRVPSAEAGRIKSGEPVKLFYDAFPYQRYGVRYASLRWISPAAESAGDTQQNGAFRALADIADEQIELRDGPRPLRAGMGGTARIVVGRRSLLSYLFEPVRAVREHLTMPPPDARRPPVSAGPDPR
ncbi:MAG: HlyD family secretion protein, partial [Panacagrimonas sp.]